MIAVALLSLATLRATPVIDRPHRYLASIVDLPLGDNERLSSFAIESWGVDYVAVCHLPPGWRITAGRSASPNGDLKGEGSHSVTWLSSRTSPELRDLVLIRLYGPVLRRDRRSGTGVEPATFKGHAAMETPDDDEPRRAPLTWRNVRLRAASRCPPLPR